jgi:hypothetical protein
MELFMPRHELNSVKRSGPEVPTESASSLPVTFTHRFEAQEPGQIEFEPIHHCGWTLRNNALQQLIRSGPVWRAGAAAQISSGRHHNG